MLNRGIITLCIMMLFTLGVGQHEVRADNNNVKDYIEVLTVQEKMELQNLIDTTVVDYNMDIVIVIVDDTRGKTSRDFADDYYDYNGYGQGSDNSGLLMLINMQDREVWISTTGRAIGIFTDKRISDMTKDIASFLSQSNYYEACLVFVNRIEYYAGSRYDSGTYMSRVLRQMKSFPVYIVALLISIFFTISLSASNKGKVTIDNQTYEEKGSFDLANSRDDYIRESTTRVKKPSSSSSSGSSTHRGSSGRSHGGGGRKF